MFVKISSSTENENLRIEFVISQSQNVTQGDDEGSVRQNSTK